MWSFTIYSVPPLVSSILFLMLGLFVYSKNKKSPSNITFALVCFVTFWWQFSWFILFNTQNENLAKYLVRIGYVGIILIPIVFFHFFIHFLEKVKKFDRYLLYFSYFLGLIFEISLVTTNYFISGFYKYFWGFYPKAGILHPLYLLLLTFLAVRILCLLFSFLKKGKEIVPSYKYYQIKYILLAIIFYIFASSDFAVNYGVEFYPVGFVFISIFLGIVAYTIIRHRLMDIRFVLGRTAVYIFSFLTVIVLAFLLIFLNNQLPQPLSFNLVGPLIIVFSIFLFQILFKFYEKIATKYFYHTFYSYQKVITDLGKKLTQILELDKLSSLIIETLMETMKLERVVVLLREETGNYQIQKNIGFKEENGISLVKDDFLTQYLERTQKPLVAEELKIATSEAFKKEEKEKIENLRTKMKKIEAALCLPLLREGKIKGLIVLGEKISQEPYSDQDIELLTTLANQSSIALENAKLYQEIKDFNRLLQQKVDEQTAEIVKKAEHLEKLLKMRSEFLDIASHQLRTPVSVILGMTSMFKEGGMDQLSKEEQDKFLESIHLKAKKLSSIINDILKASEMDTEEFRLEVKDFKPVQIEEIIKEIFQDFEAEAKDRKLKLEFIRPQEPVSLVLVHRDYLAQALSNLVDNAIKYTQRGYVRIILSEEKERVIIKIEDSGIGIPEDDKIKIFDKFSRAKNAVNTYADGSGLGLFIVKKIINAHPGAEINFVSQENKGTTFIITLPVSK